jgi:hypothetical protein
MSAIHSAILEGVVIFGSLPKSNIIELVTSDHPHASPKSVQSAIDELIQGSYLIGSQSYL